MGTASRAWTVGLVLILLSPVQADLVIDDFESYGDGQVVGPSAESAPWRRFGLATVDNIVATVSPKWVFDQGGGVGVYVVQWPNPFGGIRRELQYATDLTQYAGVSVRMRSSASTTTTDVYLAVSNGHTTYVSTKGQPLTDTAQVLSFTFEKDLMVRAAGQQDFDTVIRSVRLVGVDFRSDREDDSYTETIIIDDLKLTGGPAETAAQPDESLSSAE